MPATRTSIPSPILDADGSNLGVYRKSHIPNGPGYQEKNYFAPGDTGFKVWETRYARIGVGICWDQWFPETARVMALMGAELLLFPTAIGTEPPPAPPVNSREHWQRTQQGHAAANLTPLIAANRYGLERSLQDPQDLYVRFYGSSFIADAMGAKVAEAPEEGDAVLTHTFDLEAIAQLRNNWFVFRDRRPDLYGVLTSFDGGRSRAVRAGGARVGRGNVSVPGPAGREPCSGGGGGTVSSVAFATAWTMPSSVRLGLTDAERVIRLIAIEPDPSARPGR